MHIIRHTPEPIDLTECDDEVIRTSSRAQLQRMVTQWKRQEEMRRRLKRERSGSATVVGDEEVLGDEEIEVLGVNDLRMERHKRRKLTQKDTVVVID